jgi:anti-sigma regulatory factor (Ser/Thr protein kinase)
LEASLIDDKVYLTLPLEKKYAHILRLTVAGITAKMDFGWDQGEDVKLAAEEVFLLSLKSGKQSELEFVFEIKRDGLEIYLDAIYLDSNPQDSGEERFSFFILTGLMDDVVIEPTKNDLFNLKMVKKYW